MELSKIGFEKDKFSKQKNKFIYLQKKLKEYLNDCNTLSLKGLLNDNFVVYDYKIRRKVFEDEERYRRLKKIVKKISKLRKKDISKIIELSPEVKQFFSQLEHVEITPEEHLETTVDHIMMATVKEDMEKLRKLPEFVPKDLVLARNLTPSNSHSQVYKKFEGDGNQNKGRAIMRTGQPLIFQNGILMENQTSEGSLDQTPTQTSSLFFNNTLSKSQK
ncbi:hypothetical protein NUSPORA_02872 [Nucleospora cyclopteri]